jgi:hypothetical protein
MITHIGTVNVTAVTEEQQFSSLDRNGHDTVKTLYYLELIFKDHFSIICIKVIITMIQGLVLKTNLFNS